MRSRLASADTSLFTLHAGAFVSQSAGSKVWLLLTCSTLSHPFSKSQWAHACHLRHCLVLAHLLAPRGFPHLRVEILWCCLQAAVGKQGGNEDHNDERFQCVGVVSNLFCSAPQASLCQFICLRSLNCVICFFSVANESRCTKWHFWEQ